MAIFYLVAGLNHFRDPDFYTPLIPDYLPLPVFINMTSGVLEVLLAICLMIPKFRALGATGILVLLILFIPSHVYFIQIGACVEGGLCTSLWVAHVRLWVIHPILIIWAYSIGFLEFK
jgi:uncharacterized membrane protein